MVKTQAHSADITKNTVGLIVSFHRMGNRSKVNTSQIEVEADKELISVSKQLLEADEFDAILRLDGEMYRWLNARALPSLLRKGIWLMPQGLVEPVEAYLKENAARRTELVEAFVAVYDEKVKAAKKRLRNLFDPTDYMSADSVRASFRIEWSYPGLNTPTSLQEINKELFLEQKKKMEKLWEETADVIRQILRAELAALVGHVDERLKPAKDGKKKIIRDSVIVNLKEWLDLAPLRNVTNDAELKKFREQALTLMKGIDPELLRSDDKLREKVQQQFAKLKKSIDASVTIKSGRAVSLDDEV
jgi:hypothetical protein